MRTSIVKKAEKFIKEKSRRRRWTAAITALSAIVIVATAWVLMSPARALVGETYCGKEAHAHEDACYERVLICGQEEGLLTEAAEATPGETVEVHRHDESCYTEVKNLVCGREELEGHAHVDSCYTMHAEEELACTLEENEEHAHTEACYIRTEERVLVCEREEAEGHTHADACYATERVLSCGKEETGDLNAEASGQANPGSEAPAESGHVHSDACYERTETLICNEEEHTHEDACHKKPSFYCGELVHVHTDNCFDPEGQVICGQADCMVHIHSDACYGSKGNVICPLPEVEKHVHTEACYVQEAGAEEPKLICEKTEAEPHLHTNECLDEDGWLVCGKLEVWEHVHNAGCFTASEEKAVQRAFEGDGFAVTAVYGKEAGLPDRCVLLVKRVTAEEEEEVYTAREAEYQAFLGEEAAPVRDLLRIGFYIREQKLEPKDSVVVTLRFLGEEALKEGVPVTVIGFNDEGGAEEIPAGRTEDGGVTFRLGGFSEIAIGYGSAEEEPEETGSEEEPTEETKAEEEGEAKRPEVADQTFRLANTYEYGDKDISVRFHVEGSVFLPAEVIAGEETPETGSNEGTSVWPPEETGTKAGEPEPGTKPAGDENEGEAGKESDAETKAAEETKTVEETKAAEETKTETEPQAGDGEAVKESESEPAKETENEPAKKGGEETNETSGETEPADIPETSEPVELLTQEEFEAKLEFKVEPLTEQSGAYAAVAAYEEELGDTGEELLLQAFAYSLSYEGYELDLSNCTVTAEIMPTQALMDTAREAMEAAGEGRSPVGEGPVNDPDEAPEDSGLSNEILIEAMELLDGTDDSLSGDGSDGPVSDEAGVIPDGDGAGIGEIQVMSLREEEEITPMRLSLTSGALAVRATGQPNPKFRVQYYANLEMISKTGSNGLPVIDTSGGKLPVNGGGRDVASPNGNPIRNIYVDNDGKVLTENVLTEVYEARDCEYIRQPTINYFDALRNKPGYGLKEVWVLKEGRDEKSVDPGDWDRYTYSSALHFTNRSVSETAKPIPDNDTGQHVSSGYVYIRDNAVLRLVYDSTEGDPDFTAAFYDYDISDGYIYGTEENARNRADQQNTSSQDDRTWYSYTGRSGINSDANYIGKPGSRLAFGNANTGTGLQHEQWNANLLNKLNAAQSGHPSVSGSYKGCTFGLARDLSEDGKIQYSSQVAVPNLFNEGGAAGKTSYDEGQYSLKFNRSGDTYTLSAVNGTGVSGLESFNHPSPSAGTVHTHIWTNNFWPMDWAPSYGTDGHDMKIGNLALQTSRNFVGEKGSGGTGAVANGNFPTNDDGRDHNSYFGMRYEVGFELSEDYVGPLEYYFFGDDDMWVFLSRVDVDDNNQVTRYYDSRLVCDIGGTHSSVGEYVNLWDYMKQDHAHTDVCYGEDGNLNCEKEKENKSGKWALTFYYTERGASGSTCWMQFTLPSATSLNPEKTDQDYGDLRIEKTVTAVEGDNETEVDNNDEFSFRIELTDAQGNRLPDDYSYVKYDKNGTELGADLIIWDGAEFTLKNGEYIIIRYLPKGTKYTVIEANEAVTVIPNTGESAPDNPDDPDASDETRVPSDTEYLTDISINNIPPSSDRQNLQQDKIAAGMIEQGDVNKVHYNNKFYTYVLPETGGAGNPSYTMAGISFMLMGGLMYRKKIKERKRRTRV